MIHRSVVLAKYQVIVSSFGGVGTSFLMHYLKNYRLINCPHDMDLLKHIPMPPVFVCPGIRIIYIIGDPVGAVLSLFRRGYHIGQYPKLNGLVNLETNKQPYFSEFTDAVPAMKDVDSYAENGEDILRLVPHYQNWVRSTVGARLLVVKYESIWDHKQEIVKFAGLPESALADFPEKKARKSNPDAVDPATLSRLKKIYADFTEEYEKMPSLQCFERDAGDYLMDLLRIPLLLPSNPYNNRLRLSLSSYFG